MNGKVSVLSSSSLSGESIESADKSGSKCSISEGCDDESTTESKEHSTSDGEDEDEVCEEKLDSVQEAATERKLCQEIIQSLPQTTVQGSRVPSIPTHRYGPILGYSGQMALLAGGRSVASSHVPHDVFPSKLSSFSQRRGQYQRNFGGSRVVRSTYPKQSDRG